MSILSDFKACMRDRRGAVGLFFVLSLPFMLLVGAIAVDIGYLWSIQAQLQGTADAAALAGGSKIEDPGAAKSLATTYAQKNMPSATYGQVVTANTVVIGRWDMESQVFVPNEKPANAIKVTATMSAAGGNPAKLFFAQAVGIKAADVSASSIAYVEAQGGFCTLGLDPGASKTVEFSGNSTVDLKCGVASNSSTSDAVAVIGSATVAAPSVSMVGDINVQGAARLDSDTIIPKSPPVADPYAGLAVPSIYGCDYTNHTAKKVVTLYPGVYCGGLTVNAKANVSFEPGVYIIDNGDLRINGNSELHGSGVTFILTSSNNSAYGTLTLNGGAEIALSAPSEGDLAGVLFFQDRAAPAGGKNKINGGAEIEFKGLLYFPSQALEFTGGAEADNGCTHIIAETVKISGNANLENNCEDTGLKPLGGKAISLVG